LAGSTAEARAPEEDHRSANQPGVPSGIRTRVSRMRIWLPGPSSKMGTWQCKIVNREPSAGFEPATSRLEDGRPSAGRRGHEQLLSTESRPGIEPGTAVLQTTFLARDPAREHETPRAVEENRTPVPSLARSDSTTELPPQNCEASSGNRTRIDGLEDRGPTLGRCPRDIVPDCYSYSTLLPSSCSRELHSPYPAYQAGAPLSGPEQRSWSRLDSNQPLPGANRMLSRVSYDPFTSNERWSAGESNPDFCHARAVFSH
jgi:hypothetical protein